MASLLQVRPVADQGGGNAGKPPHVLLIGEERQVHRGRLLLEIHVRQQKEIQRFHDLRLKKLKILEEAQSKYESSARAEFVADESLVGLIVGKGGEKVNRVQAEY